MQKLRVGVLRGGIGEGYDSSLKYGGEILSFLTDYLGHKFKIHDIFIDADGVWHFSGLPVLPGDLINKVDVVWNATHPTNSNILESVSVPTVSTPFFSHAIEKNPTLLKEFMKQNGIEMARSVVFPVYQADFDGPVEKYITKKAREVWQKFSPPWIVRPFSLNANIGIRVAKTFPDLVEAITELVNEGESILVEELIYGKVARVHAVPGFRGEEIYVLPPAEVKDDRIHLGSFKKEEKEKLVNFAKDICKHIGSTHYIDSALVMTPKGKIYLKTISLAPDLTDDSCLHRSLEYLGVKREDVLEHMLHKARML